MSISADRIAELEEELRQFEDDRRRLRQLTVAVEQSPSVVVITDTNGTFEYVNKKFTALTGYTLDEVRGRNPRILKSGRTPSSEYARLWETITSGGTWRGEFLNCRKDGTLYWGAAIISPIFDEQGVISHFIEVMEDITERKELEQALVSVSEGERQQFGQDLHDVLGQQLTGISLLAKSLAVQLKDQSCAHAAAALEIEQLAKKAVGETKRLARGLFPTELRKNGLLSALDHLTDTLSTLYSVKCEFEGEEDLPMLGPSSSLHFYRIAQEATHNAIKHGDPTRVTIRLFLEEEYLVLEVEDDGKGIPDDIQPGKGMGLLIMAHRADLIRGTFKVCSRPEGGTLATCRLPVSYAQLELEHEHE